MYLSVLLLGSYAPSLSFGRSVVKVFVGTTSERKTVFAVSVRATPYCGAYVLPPRCLRATRNALDQNSKCILVAQTCARVTGRIGMIMEA
jgi:hypothetical protein